MSHLIFLVAVAFCDSKAFALTGSADFHERLQFQIRDKQLTFEYCMGQKCRVLASLPDDSVQLGELAAAAHLPTGPANQILIDATTNRAAGMKQTFGTTGFVIGKTRKTVAICNDDGEIQTTIAHATKHQDYVISTEKTRCSLVAGSKLKSMTEEAALLQRALGK